MATEYTREQLYELVWSKPMTHLAKEFGLSDVGLRKTCLKYGIPTPPAGWWARKAAGRADRQPVLRPLKQGLEISIKLPSPDDRPETAAIAIAMEAARHLANEPARPLDSVAVAIIEQTLTKLEKVQNDARSLRTVSAGDFINCSVSENALARLKIFLPELTREAAKQGFTLRKGDTAARFERDGETIDFAISEGVKTKEHILTPDEMALQKKWELKHQRASRLNEWDIWRQKPQFPAWDFHPTGNLSLELEQVYVVSGTPPRRTFRDAKIQRLENMAEKIALGLAAMSAAKTEKRLWQEDQDRRAEIARIRREERARLAHIEDKRQKQLQGLLAELDEIDRLRRLIGMVTSEIPSEGLTRTTDFLVWSKNYLAEREAAISAASLEERFTQAKVFGDDDSNGFYPNRWC